MKGIPTILAGSSVLDCVRSVVIVSAKKRFLYRSTQPAGSGSFPLPVLLCPLLLGALICCAVFLLCFALLCLCSLALFCFLLCFRFHFLALRPDYFFSFRSATLHCCCCCCFDRIGWTENQERRRLCNGRLRHRRPLPPVQDCQPQHQHQRATSRYVGGTYMFRPNLFRLSGGGGGGGGSTAEDECTTQSCYGRVRLYIIPKL